MTKKNRQPVIQVGGLRKDHFDSVRAVAERFGHLSDAAVIRFAFTQFAQGLSIKDFSSHTRATG